MDKPLVMGILNLTPDSFFTGSRVQTTDAVLRRAEEMLRDGATILDIGGQSTRPGSEKLDADTEWHRIEAPIAAVSRHFPELYVSVDTYYASVAVKAVAAGASIINDISAGTLDEGMAETVAGLQVPYVLMHMKGSPQTMTREAVYADVTTEVLDVLTVQKTRFEKLGVKDIIIDPGFGFAKTTEHNFTLLQQLPAFSLLQAPLLLGISRKSFIWKTLQSCAGDAITLTGTTALHMAGLMKGASILRVHDVREAAACIKLYTHLQ